MRPDTRLPFLDVLRASAIILVLCCHHIYLPGAPAWFVWFASRSNVGVDVFFVLSGYLIGGQLLREFHRTGTIHLTRFWGRRWLRTLPVYYAMFLPLVFGGVISTTRAPEFVFFLQNYTSPRLWDITWSLCVEEHFYLLLPLVVVGVAWLSRVRFLLPLVVASLLLLSPVLRALAWQPWETKGEFIVALYMPTHFRLDGLALGVLVAALQVWRHPVWQWCEAHARGVGVAGGALFFVSVWSPVLTGWAAMGDDQGFLAAVPLFALVNLGVAGLLVYGVTARPQRLIPGAAWVSDHAYTLYLTHLFALAFVQALIPQSAGFPLTFTLSIGLACSFSALLRLVVEVPGLRLREQLFALGVTKGSEPFQETPPVLVLNVGEVRNG